MARIRSIKPEFFLDDEIADLPPLARLLFVGLWTQADKAGRLKDKPIRIKTAVLPYDECDCDELLTLLHNAGFIVRYQHEQGHFIQVVNFDKHQRFNNEADSVIPAVSEDYVRTSVGLTQGKEGKGREGKGEDARPKGFANFPDCTQTDSVSLNGRAGPFLPSAHHVLLAIEAKWGIVAPTDIGRIAKAMKARCEAHPGCTGATSDRCARFAISKIERANTPAAAAKFIEQDKGERL